jgi:predicted PurR-regulated permease PerM
VALLLTIISGLVVAVVRLMLPVLSYINEAYAQQNQTYTNVISLQQTLPPLQQQNQTQSIGTASETENLRTGNIPMIGNKISGSIGEAIAEPDEFLGNITENLATPGPVETFINKTSYELGLQ